MPERLRWSAQDRQGRPHEGDRREHELLDLLIAGGEQRADRRGAGYLAGHSARACGVRIGLMHVRKPDGGSRASPAR